MKKKPFSLDASLQDRTAILIAAWRKLLKLPVGPLDRLQTREFRSVVAAVDKLHKENDLKDREQLGAYLLYDWQLHHAQALSLLSEIPSTPRRVLEIGCGGAPFALAAVQKGSSEVVGLDINAAALKAAGEVCGKLGYPLSLRQHDCRSQNFPVEGKWDLIIAAYSLFEIAHHPFSYVQALMNRLNEQGFLLIVEPSHKEANQRLLTLRNEAAHNKISIQAPCLWQGDCPALKNALKKGTASCYAQRPFERPELIKEIQRSLRLHLNSLKMSYLLLRNTQTRPLERALYRVVSPPVETLYGKRFFLCGNQGQKTLGSSLKEHPKRSRAFEYLKRGDLVSIQNALERRDDLEVTQDTRVALEAPCDKPVPEV